MGWFGNKYNNSKRWHNGGVVGENEPQAPAVITRGESLMQRSDARRIQGNSAGLVAAMKSADLINAADDAKTSLMAQIDDLVAHENELRERIDLDNQRLASVMKAKAALMLASDALTEKVTKPLMAAQRLGVNNKVTVRADDAQLDKMADELGEALAAAKLSPAGVDDK